jgi:hypothetical protein
MTRREARTKLLRLLRPGSTVYLFRVADRRASTLVRVIAVHRNEPHDISDAVHVLADVPVHRQTQTLILPMRPDYIGSGPLVYRLADALWPDGFRCLGDTCPSTDHDLGVPVSWHATGGHALRFRWL